MHNEITTAPSVPAQPNVSGLTTSMSATLSPEDEGLTIRKALRCLPELDAQALWVDRLIAHVLGKTLVETEDDCDMRPRTNIQPWLVNGVGILLTIFAVDEDLEFIYREHKFDPAGFRTIDSKELLKPIEAWQALGYGSGKYGSGTFKPDKFGVADYAFDPYSGAESECTPERRKRVLEMLTNAGLLDRKPNLNPTTLVIRLRGDRIVAALKEISPLHYGYLNY
jgi:hypothetical protein